MADNVKRALPLLAVTDVSETPWIQCAAHNGLVRLRIDGQVILLDIDTAHKLMYAVKEAVDTARKFEKSSKT